MKTITIVIFLILGSLFLVSCGGSDDSNGGSSAASCALQELPYPRPEPVYNGKMARDFTPFAAALDAYTAEQATARETLVSGKTVPELQALMDNGDLTSVDLVVYYLERIQRYDVDKLNSVLELNPDVLDIAQSLDDERAAGTVRGGMHGIPVLLKDNIATGDDLHTAAGAAAMLDWNPERDAFLVSQLRDAGAIILGKANLSEWANWSDPCAPNGFSTTGGQTQNPYGAFETYGSSSGSAVSVAAELTAVSVGSETQGSIILPSAINSAVALKTSRGLVSGDYIIPLLSWQDVPGPIGRTVTDVAVLLSAMVGVDANDPNTTDAAALDGTDFTQFLTAEALADVRVGIPVWNDAAFADFFESSGITDEEQQANIRTTYEADNEAIRAAGELLSAAGATVVEIPKTAVPKGLPVAPALEYGYKEAINAFLPAVGNGAPASLEAIIAFNSEDLTNRAPYGQGHLEASQNPQLSPDEYETVKNDNQRLAREGLDGMFAEYGIDVVVSDVAQTYAPAGYPALTVPSGYDADGKPQNVVFVGGFLSEPQLLAVGYAYEQAAQAWVAPDLEATMGLIEAMGK